MSMNLSRAIETPIRTCLTWDQLWMGHDRGLIWCWERGRQKRFEEPELATRAEQGELVTLAWKGGAEEKLAMDEKPGSLNYLATWQGLRNEDLDIDIDEKRIICCSKSGQVVVFSTQIPIEDGLT